MGYQVFYNAEMLVGDSDITQHTEIERLFERMEIRHDPEYYSNVLSSQILAYVESINKDTSIPIDRSGETRLHVTEEGDVTTLLFEFGGAQVHRTQRVPPTGHR